MKYLDRVSEGGDPAMKVEMKAWVWRASGEGSGGEAVVDMVLGTFGAGIFVIIVGGGYSGLERDVPVAF